MSSNQDRPKTTGPENEIRVSERTNVIRGVDRVEEAFKKFDNVTLSGINNGISKVLLITEIVKLKIKDLYQYNLIETIKREVHEENKEEESDVHPKFLTRFKVELYKKKLDKPPKDSFYEAPYTEEQITKIKEVKPQEGREGREGRERPLTGRPRARGRGGPRGDRGRGGQRGGPRGERGRGGPRGSRGDRGRGAQRGGSRGDRGRGGPRGGRGEGRGRGGQRGEGRGRGRGGARGGKPKEGETSENK